MAVLSLKIVTISSESLNNNYFVQLKVGIYLKLTENKFSEAGNFIGERSLTINCNLK